MRRARGVVGCEAVSAPRRRHRLTLDLQADNEQEMVRSLEYIAYLLDTGQLTKGCSGGVHSGWTYEYSVDESVTHESYFQAIRAWKAERGE